MSRDWKLNCNARAYNPARVVQLFLNTSRTQHNFSLLIYNKQHTLVIAVQKDVTEKTQDEENNGMNRFKEPQEAKLASHFQKPQKCNAKIQTNGSNTAQNCVRLS